MENVERSVGELNSCVRVVGELTSCRVKICREKLFIANFTFGAMLVVVNCVLPVLIILLLIEELQTFL